MQRVEAKSCPASLIKSIIFDFDADGMIFNRLYHSLPPDVKEPERLIRATKLLRMDVFQRISRYTSLAQLDIPPIPVVFYLGTNRQNIHREIHSMMQEREDGDFERTHYTSSSTYALTFLAERIARAIKNPVIRDDILLNDIFEGCPIGETFRVTQELTREAAVNYHVYNQSALLRTESSYLTVESSIAGTRREPNISEEIIKRKYQNHDKCLCSGDEDKIFQLYVKMHRAASHAPNETIDYYFYDDMGEIIDRLNFIFTEYPSLRPRNVNLHLIHFDREKFVDKYCLSDKDKKALGGDIDFNYQENVKLLEGLYKQHIDPGQYSNPKQHSIAQRLSGSYNGTRLIRLFQSLHVYDSDVASLDTLGVLKSFLNKFLEKRVLQNQATIESKSDEKRKASVIPRLLPGQFEILPLSLDSSLLPGAVPQVYPIAVGPGVEAERKGGRLSPVPESVSGSSEQLSASISQPQQRVAEPSTSTGSFLNSHSRSLGQAEASHSVSSAVVKRLPPISKEQRDRKAKAAAIKKPSIQQIKADIVDLLRAYREEREREKEYLCASFWAFFDAMTKKVKLTAVDKMIDALEGRPVTFTYIDIKALTEENSRLGNIIQTHIIDKKVPVSSFDAARIQIAKKILNHLSRF